MSIQILRAILVLLSYLLPICLFAQSFVLHQEKTYNQRIEPGQTHTYTLELGLDDMVFVRFEQESTDISIRVKDPAGLLIEEFDGNNGKQGPELVHINPHRAGTYSLAVSPLEEQKKAGNYWVKIDTWVPKGNQPQAQLDQIISYWADQQYLPGFAVAVFDKEKVFFQKGYGYADIAQQKPYSLTTLQNIGSVSKTLIGISLMKAVEEGKLQLESEINDYLPFEVQNPYFPNQPIRVRHLASHTSSIAEMPAYEKSYILKEPFTYQEGEIGKGAFKDMQLYAKNKEQSMGEFLKSLLAKEGELYRKKHFRKHAPGEKYAYSNAGATLAAYIIERLYDMSYADFTKKYILEPLGMNASGWSFEDIDSDKHSKLYFGNYKPMPKYSLITYPDGGLLTNIQDLTRYLQSQMQGYYGEPQLISTESYKNMMSPKLTEQQQSSPNRNYGLFWEFRGDHIGHNGGDPGAVCFIRFDAKTGIGRIIMTNIIPAAPMAGKQFSTIWKLLGEMGADIQKAGVDE